MKWIVYGQLQSKSNCRRLVFNRHTKRPMFIKSQVAMDFSKQFELQIANQIYNCGWSMITEPCKIVAHVWYQSNRSDLDISLLKDLCQKCELIKNDRLIIEEHSYKHIDKENPRVEFELEIIQ